MIFLKGAVFASLRLNYYNLSFSYSIVLAIDYLNGAGRRTSQKDYYYKQESVKHFQLSSKNGIPSEMVMAFSLYERNCLCN